MDCDSIHHPSWLEKFGVDVKSCPDDQYCCVEGDRVYCCSSSELVSKRQVRTLRARTRVYTHTHTQGFNLNL